MNSIKPSELSSLKHAQPPLMGLAPLMTMAFEGVNLMPLAAKMIERAQADEHDANALMDLSTILMLQGIADVGLATQAQALQISRLYELPATRPIAIRVLAIMTPGDLMTNSPLPFLLADSNASLSMFYIAPGETLPTDLPEHDLLFMAVSESDQTQALLRQLEIGLAGWTKPVCNRPNRIARTSRAQAYSLLAGAGGITMPASTRVAREQLESLLQKRVALDDLLNGGVFPLIIRPVDSHAGHGLEKLERLEELPAYLAEAIADEFFISRFIDYCDEDGLFRKYRVAIIEGKAFAVHMGVSAHWMIHYLNAGMTQSAEKRAEEESFMRTFDEAFGRRHAAALTELADRFALDYLLIDCAETADGKLLVFEVDPGAVVHAMDPLDLFPYKQPAMKKLFAAFHAMLAHKVAAFR